MPDPKNITWTNFLNFYGVGNKKPLEFSFQGFRILI
jgi:hypothetical protein